LRERLGRARFEEETTEQAIAIVIDRAT